MTTKKSGAPQFLSGLWGEGLTVQSLRQSGFEVEWQGGLTTGHDLKVRRGGRWWFAQVKATQHVDGYVPWQKDGASAFELAEKARRQGGAGAFYVLVQIHTHGEHSVDLEAGQIIISLPPDAALVALSAETFGRDVDAARAAYGRQARVRAGNNGEKVGDYLDPSKLRFPLQTGDYPDLEDFLKEL